DAHEGRRQGCGKASQPRIAEIFRFARGKKSGMIAFARRAIWLPERPAGYLHHFDVVGLEALVDAADAGHIGGRKRYFRSTDRGSRQHKRCRDHRADATPRRLQGSHFLVAMSLDRPRLLPVERRTYWRSVPTR